ncbi:hypothetical protein [Streptomyces sp. Ncost-T10-10d]|uniref:pirin family protein n=1 Tax=Streptomyces sp. Ncost-T10-10d TaxID=1839774 RepID=UPI00081E2353|nr:hypothetical protein [Streptomyces sp. Ncost-T10-10d]SCF72857.1 hypothetical protein GA0115254_113911 [Streptomyces sp. Ncost-T10-10d]
MGARKKIRTRIPCLRCRSESRWSGAGLQIGSACAPACRATGADASVGRLVRTPCPHNGRCAQTSSLRKKAPRCRNAARAGGLSRKEDSDTKSYANRFTALHASRLSPGQSIELPHAPFLHLFVAKGAVALESSGPLADGDAVRFTATGGQRVTADRDAEILVREIHATVRLG